MARRDAMKLSPKLKARVRAIERAIEKLRKSALDSSDTYKVSQTIQRGIDNFEQAARREGITDNPDWFHYTDPPWVEFAELRDRLFRDRVAAGEQARENYRQYLQDELRKSHERVADERAKRLSTPHGQYEEELRLMRGRDPRSSRSARGRRR